MTATNRWSEEGRIRKGHLLRAKLTLTTKATNSSASAVVGDYYEFNCKSKQPPRTSAPPTWNDVTDNPSEPTGYAYAGKPEQLEQIELVTRTPIQTVYDELEAHRAAGDVFTLSYVYDDPQETSVYTITLTNVQIIQLNTEGTDSDAWSTTIVLLPEGGSSANMPAVTATTRT